MNDGRVRRDAMLPETCPACGIAWGNLADDHSAVTDWRAAFDGRDRVVCQGTVSAAEYAALREQRRVARGTTAATSASGRTNPGPGRPDRFRQDQRP